MGTLLEQILNHKEEPGTVYGSLWPTKYKVDSKGNPMHGTLAFDPGAGMLGSLARSAHELLTVPGNVASGKRPLTNDLGPRLAGDMFNLGVGAGSVAGPAGRSVAGMFTGPGARYPFKVDEMAVNEAENMEERGHGPSEIWQSTGLFRGGDGKWRGEVSDANAKVKTENLNKGQLTGTNFYMPTSGGLTAGDVIDHPDLYAAYPHLKQLSMDALPLGKANSIAGQYDPSSMSISMFGGREPDVLSTMLHEFQHAVDHYEGRQYGANQDMFVPQSVKNLASELPGKRNELVERMKEEGRPGQPFNREDFDPDATADYIDALHQAVQTHFARKSLPGSDHALLSVARHEPWFNDFVDYSVQRQAVKQANQKAYDLYIRTGGEVMARNVQNRLRAFQPDMYTGMGGAPDGMLVRKKDGEFLTMSDSRKLENSPAMLSPHLTEDVGRQFQIWNPNSHRPSNSSLPPSDEEQPLFRTNPFKLADEHQQNVTGLETQAYTTAMKPKGGSAPALGKPGLHLVQGDGAGGDRPNFLLDRQGNYLGMFPSNMDAQGVKKMAADHVGLGQYKAGIDTATTNMSPQQRADKIATLKEMARQPVRTMSGRTPAQEKAYMAAVKQQQLQKQNANVLSLNRATVPSFGEHHTVEQLPTGLFRVTRPNGDQIYYNAAGDWVGGGQPSIAQRSSISEFLKRGEK